ncbi:hypothetical protein ACJW31_11G128700 [Castanea mollissima]
METASHWQFAPLPLIVISSPKAAKEVPKTHDPTFANRASVLVVEATTYDNSSMIFAPYGDYWRQMRKICVLELLSPSRVQSFRSIREEEVLNLIESISLSKGLSINLSEKIFSSTYSITSRAAFGNKCRYEKEFISLVKETFLLSGGFHLPDLFPSIKFLSFLTGMKSAMEHIHKHKMKRSHFSAANKHEPDYHDDLVDVLLKLQQTSDLEFHITTNHVKAIILDVFSAASEASASTIEWTMSELLRNPKAMEKAQAEVRVLEGGRNINETNIQKLNYLKLVVKETLRFHPPAAFNTRVIINAWAIGRDPEHWVDADCFHPERFLGSLIDFKGTNFEFIPFGGGRRVCPGISFALANVELVLSQLLYHFDWKLPIEIKPEEFDMSESFGFTCTRKNHLYLIAIPWSPLSHVCKTH